MDTVLDYVTERYDSDVHLAAFPVLKLTFFFWVLCIHLKIMLKLFSLYQVMTYAYKAFLLCLDLGGVDLI